MKKLVTDIIWGVYRLMQRHYITFRFLMWLKERGVMRKISYWLFRFNNKAGRSAEDMKKSLEFFSSNAERAEKVLSLLADEKSRIVYGGVVRYRTEGIQMGPELYTENDQYFVEGIIKIDNGEVFIDVGGFIGDTAQVFIDLAKRAGVKFRKLVVFEPDQANCDLIKKHFGKRKDVVLIEKGLSDKEDTLYFAGDGPWGRVVDDPEESIFSIPVIDLDSVPEGQDATWIKMDIEGSEMSALKGAQNVIRRNHPKLTICIYHSDEDMLRIAEYIHDLVPEYKLYVRCHKGDGTETVLYAIP